MAGFLYFVPAEEPKAVHPGVYAGLSLEATLDGLTPEATWVPAFPIFRDSGGRELGSGWLLRDGRYGGGDAFPLAVVPKDQAWSLASPQPGVIEHYAVGIWKDAPPQPVELVREQALSGYDCKLGDGNRWTIPLVLVSDEAKALPAVPMQRTLSPDGQWVNGSPIAQYAHLLGLVQPFWDAWHAAITEALEANKDRYTVPAKALEDLAVLLLAVNYRVSRAEVGLLGLLLSTGTAREIAELACDVPVALDWLLRKKNAREPVVSSSSAG